MILNDQKISRRKENKKGHPGSPVRNLQIEIHPSASLFSLLSSLVVARHEAGQRPSHPHCWLLMQRVQSARATLKNGRPAMIQSFARTGRYRVDGRTLRWKYSAKQVAVFTSRPPTDERPLARRCPTFPRRPRPGSSIYPTSILWTAVFQESVG